MVILLEAPDSLTTAGIMLGAITPGSFKATRTTGLFMGEEGAEIMRKTAALFPSPG